MSLRTFAMIWALAHLTLATPQLLRRLDNTHPRGGAGGAATPGAAAGDGGGDGDDAVGSAANSDSEDEFGAEDDAATDADGDDDDADDPNAAVAGANGGAAYGVDTATHAFVFAPKRFPTYDRVIVHYRIGDGPVINKRMTSSAALARWEWHDPGLSLVTPADAMTSVTYFFTFCGDRRCQSIAPVTQLLGAAVLPDAVSADGDSDGDGRGAAVLRHIVPRRSAIPHPTREAANDAVVQTRVTSPGRRLLQLQQQQQSAAGSSAAAPVTFTSSVRLIASNGIFALSFMPTAGSVSLQWVDAHFQVNGGPVFNYRMGLRTDSAQGLYEYSGILLQNGDQLCFWFTYLTAANVAFDTASACFTASGLAAQQPVSPSGASGGTGDSSGGSSSGPQTQPNPNAALIPAISTPWQRSASGEFQSQFSTIAGVAGQYVVTFQPLPATAGAVPLQPVTAVTLNLTPAGRSAPTAFALAQAGAVWSKVVPLTTTTASYTFAYTRAGASAATTSPAQAFDIEQLVQSYASQNPSIPMSQIRQFLSVLTAPTTTTGGGSSGGGTSGGGVPGNGGGSGSGSGGIQPQQSSSPAIDPRVFQLLGDPTVVVKLSSRYPGMSPAQSQAMLSNPLVISYLNSLVATPGFTIASFDASALPDMATINAASAGNAQSGTAALGVAPALNPINAADPDTQWYTHSITSQDGGQTFALEFFANAGVAVDFVDLHYAVANGTQINAAMQPLSARLFRKTGIVLLNPPGVPPTPVTAAVGATGAPPPPPSPFGTLTYSFTWALNGKARNSAWRSFTPTAAAISPPTVPNPAPQNASPSPPTPPTPGVPPIPPGLSSATPSAVTPSAAGAAQPLGPPAPLLPVAPLNPFTTAPPGLPALGTTGTGAGATASAAGAFGSLLQSFLSGGGGGAGAGGGASPLSSGGTGQQQQVPMPPVSVSVPTSQGAVTLTTTTPQQQAVAQAGGNPLAALLPTQSTLTALSSADPNKPTTAGPVLASAVSQIAGAASAFQSAAAGSTGAQGAAQPGLSATGDRISATTIDPLSGNTVTIGIPMGTGANSPLNQIGGTGANSLGAAINNLSTGNTRDLPPPPGCTTAGCFPAAGQSQSQSQSQSAGATQANPSAPGSGAAANPPTSTGGSSPPLPTVSAVAPSPGAATSSSASAAAGSAGSAGSAGTTSPAPVQQPQQSTQQPVAVVVAIDPNAAAANAGVQPMAMGTTASASVAALGTQPVGAEQALANLAATFPFSLLAPGTSLASMVTAGPTSQQTNAQTQAQAQAQQQVVRVVLRDGSTVPVQVPAGVSPTTFVSMVEELLQASCPQCSAALHTSESLQTAAATAAAPVAAGASASGSAAPKLFGGLNFAALANSAPAAAADSTGTANTAGTTAAGAATASPPPAASVGTGSAGSGAPQTATPTTPPAAAAPPGVTQQQAQAMYAALASQLNGFLSSQLSANARQQLGSFVPDTLPGTSAGPQPSGTAQRAGTSLGEPLVAAMEALVVQQLNAQFPGITSVLQPAGPAASKSMTQVVYGVLADRINAMAQRAGTGTGTGADTGSATGSATPGPTSGGANTLAAQVDALLQTPQWLQNTMNSAAGSAAAANAAAGIPAPPQAPAFQFAPATTATAGSGSVGAGTEASTSAVDMAGAVAQFLRAFGGTGASGAGAAGVGSGVNAAGAAAGTGAAGAGSTAAAGPTLTVAGQTVNLPPLQPPVPPFAPAP